MPKLNIPVYELITGQLMSNKTINYMIVKDKEVVKQGTSESQEEINKIYEDFKKQ